MKIGFVFTNFNNSQFTREAVQSITLNEFEGEYYIVIVDNKSDVKEIELLKELKLAFPDIQLVLNSENFGYFKGLNIGIKNLRLNHQNIDYIVIGNNDLLFPIDFIKSVYSNETIFEQYPVVSPDLITLDGIHQNPHVIKEISKLRELIYDLYHGSYRMAVLISFLAKTTKKITDRKDEKQFSIAQTIYQGYGACYILSKTFFRYFEQLWAPTFLLGEEFFLSKQLESKKMKIFYEPGIKVIHQEHASISKIPKKMLWKFSRESHKLYRKYVKAWK
jgi:GT2 family glycosyltransferase